LTWVLSTADRLQSHNAETAQRGNATQTIVAAFLGERGDQHLSRSVGDRRPVSNDAGR
jgi:hypothetical protein